jgi:hypothetical protein
MSGDDSLALVEANLTVEEAAFVRYLVKDPELNLSDAARAAGYTGKHPHDFAARMLKSNSVAKAVALIHADRRTRHKDIRDGVIQALWQLATWDIKDLCDDGGGFLPPSELPDALRAAGKGVKMGKYGLEYTFVDRAQILALLLKHFGEVDRKEESKAETEEGVSVVWVTPETVKTEGFGK